MKQLIQYLTNGNIRLPRISVGWYIHRHQKRPNNEFDLTKYQYPFRLHLGPRPNWVKLIEVVRN